MFDPKKVTAEQIMTRDVVTLAEDASIAEAVATLDDYGVSGAPVVNASGECRGVLSLADVARRRADGDRRETPSTTGYFDADPLDEQGFRIEPDEATDLGGDLVGDWMSGEIESVTPDTSLEAVCRMMFRASIHRVLVLEGKTVRGIISSLDIVRLVGGISD